MASEADTFNTALRTYAVAEQDKFMEMLEKEDENAEAQEIADNIPLFEILNDKEILTQHLESSKENVDAKINDKDTEITKAIQEDWNATMSRISED